MTTYYVGLDVHSKQSAFVIEDEGGKVIAQGEVPTTPDGFSRLQARYELARGTQVALETGTVAFFVARQLGRLGLDPIVVDAHEVRLEAPRPNQKSDRRDASELCEGVRRGIYRSIVHVPGQEVSRLRDTLSRRRHFVRLQAAQVGAVKALLRAADLGHLSRSLGSEAGWTRVLAALAQHEELRTYAEQHRALWRCAREQVTALEASLARQQKEVLRRRDRPSADHPRCRTDRGIYSGRCLLHRRALSRCQARGELRRTRALDLPVGRTRGARVDHQARIGRAARDAL